MLNCGVISQTFQLFRIVDGYEHYMEVSSLIRKQSIWLVANLCIYSCRDVGKTHFGFEINMNTTVTQNIFLVLNCKKSSTFRTYDLYPSHEFWCQSRGKRQIKNNGLFSGTRALHWKSTTGIIIFHLLGVCIDSQTFIVVLAKRSGNTYNNFNYSNSYFVTMVSNNLASAVFKFHAYS